MIPTRQQLSPALRVESRLCSRTAAVRERANVPPVNDRRSRSLFSSRSPRRYAVLPCTGVACFAFSTTTSTSSAGRGSRCSTPTSRRDDAAAVPRAASNQVFFARSALSFAAPVLTRADASRRSTLQVRSRRRCKSSGSSGAAARGGAAVAPAPPRAHGANMYVRARACQPCGRRAASAHVSADARARSTEQRLLTCRAQRANRSAPQAKNFDSSG